MRLSAAGCLRRGWTNLSANWELVLLQWLQSFAVMALMALGVFLSLLIVGANLLRTDWRAVHELQQQASRLSPALLLALVALLAVWLSSLLLHCYFQAGTFGILTAADRQALPGARRNRDFFRTFSLRDFLGWGGRYVWRFFGVLAVFGILLFALGERRCSGCSRRRWAAGSGGGRRRWGSAAAARCRSASWRWWPASGFHLAQADLARDGSGVRAASRRGLAVLGRRLGAVIVLFLLTLTAALALAALFFPLAAAADTLLAGAPLSRTLVRFLLFLLQGLPNTLLATLLAGALVALVRSETPSEIRRNSEVQTA